MNLKFHVSFFSCLILVGCGINRQVTANEPLEWHPKIISMNSCPDLTGSYKYDVIRHSNGGISIKLIPFYAGSVFEMNKTGRAASARSTAQSAMPDFQSYYLHNLEENKKNYASGAAEQLTQEILHLTQTRNFLIQENFDTTAMQRATKLGTAAAGCSNGSLVLRYVENYGGNDFIPRSIAYGEFELRKTSDGSLMVSRRERRARISYATGEIGESVEFPSITEIYPRAKQ